MASHPELESTRFLSDCRHQRLTQTQSQPADTEGGRLVGSGVCMLTVRGRVLAKHTHLGQFGEKHTPTPAST